jgi:hypothetical protein
LASSPTNQFMLLVMGAFRIDAVPFSPARSMGDAP